MLKKLLNALSRALWDSDLISTRLTLAISELCWAIMLFWIGDTFDRPAYTYMASIMSEELWATLFFISSCIQFGIVLSEKYHTTFARVFSGWNAVLWCYVVISMLISVYPPSADIGGEIGLAIAAFWIWVRPHILVRGYERASRQ